jgi:hypothetical protein
MVIEKFGELQEGMKNKNNKVTLTNEMLEILTFIHDKTAIQHADFVWKDGTDFGYERLRKNSFILLIHGVYSLELIRKDKNSNFYQT